MQTRNYNGIITEVARILRPRGLFLSCEWGRYPAFHPSFNLDPAHYVPALCRFYDILNEALQRCRGLSPIAARVSSWISRSGLFTEIETQDFYMPIGSWPTDPDLQRLGKAVRAAFLRFTDSVRPLMLESGLSSTQVDALYANVRNELSSVGGLVLVYHTVHARKA